uniref:Stereocilin n=1 Tax=Amphiprion percula TaxID=161767 RepID=A0A3P8T5S2_AMPPE
GGSKEDQREAILREIISKWSKGSGQNPQKPPPETNKEQSVHTWVRNIVGSLKTLGLLPTKSLPSLNKPIDKHRLSGFLYNISLYLQEMGAELEELPAEPDEEQLWEKVLHYFLQSEGTLNQWNGRVPPRPSVRVQDWFLSLRGSPHWDWLLGLLQSLISLSERQPHRPLLSFLSQNWRTVSAVLEAALQALVSGTYGQASAGLQGFICALKGRNDCAFSVSWLQQLLQFLETRNWKPVVSLHPAGEAAEHTKGTGTYGRLKPFDLRQLILGIRNNVMWNTQALGVSSQGLPSSLPFLSCPSNERDELRSRQTKAQASSKTAPSSETISKQKRLHEPSATSRSQLRHSQAGKRESNNYLKEMEFSTSTEILEAACNESIPGLTGVSNFTVFLYCKLFEGENGSVNPEIAQMGLDLHATCSDAAWYLSAAEEDFLWVHVCSEFFAHEFNNTVCANSSFWLQRAHQQAALTKDYSFFNQTSIDDLCVQLSGDAIGSPGLDDSCLAQLSSRSLSAQAFRHCFLPNNSVLTSALCGRDSSEPHRSLPEGSWAAAYCSKMHNFSHEDASVETCQYREWTVHHFTNSTVLELCGQTHGLREYICLNATLYHQLLRLKPQLADVCADLQAEQEARKCFLQRFFDMLPAPYEFDTSQLCVDPAPLLADVVHKLSVCEVEGGQREGFLVALGYVLRVLDFMVGLSSGLDEGEKEARQGLGQAILLSSLLDNTSWSTLQPEASMSVLHTVGVFLRREQNATLKEDLLSCFSPVLWDLIQRDDNSSALRVLLQEYLQMPRDSIRTLVMSAEKDAVKRFLSHMHQSWDQLQVETSQASQKELQAMETMTAAFIHKFPQVTPELFVDLSQFIPFMSVSDIMSFPASLIVNDSLTAIRDHSSGMKSLQKKAFVKRLLQSSVVGDVPTWPPYFLSSILPLLPYLPISHFQQLTSQQLTPLVELLGNGSLDGVRGRHVLRTLFSKKKNLTGDNIMLGVLACYLDPSDLGSYLEDSAVSSDLWLQLSQCMSKGFISASGRLSSWLVPAVQSLNVSSMNSPELSALSGLLPQLGASFLMSLPSQQLLEVLSQPGLHRFSPAQNITQQVNCLLPFVPLRKLIQAMDGETVLRGISMYRDINWSPQQAQLLFSKIQEFQNITSKSVSLGQIAGGMSCDFLRLWINDTDFAELLQFVSELPGGTRPALRKCIVEELRKQPDIDLNALSSGFAAALVTMLENLSNASFRAILDHIQTHFADFLKLPHYKQTNLAEKAVTELGTTLDILGPLLPFLDRDSLALVDRRALTLRLEEIRSFCVPKEALRDISALLTQRDLLDPSKWQTGDVEHLGRLVFALSTKQINSIPLLNKDIVEQVLVGQRRWEDSVVPSCADIRGTFPSAWTPTQLNSMSQEELKLCVEVFGGDSSLSSEQRRSLWGKLKQPVRELRADQVLMLGSVVTEMGERELQDANLTDPGVLAHLGTLTDWSPKKRAVILSVMRKRKLKAEQLTAVDLAHFGHLICGLYPSEMKRLSSYNLMAILFLRDTSLPCTEQQMEALTSCLSRPEAFGPVSAWGPEVFTEIGTLAGLPDLVLSALLQEQVEGITPEAVALMQPKKMAQVVFSAVQLSWLSVEQAWAVTDEQWAELDTEQRHAVGLARYEGDVLLELR